MRKIPCKLLQLEKSMSFNFENGSYGIQIVERPQRRRKLAGCPSAINLNAEHSL